MESKTKHSLNQTQIEALVSKHFGHTGPVVATELTEGMMNAIYRLQFDGHEMVLKVGARPDEPLLQTYENHLTRAEVEAFRAYREAGLPVPEVLAVDFSRELIDSDCFFMTVAEGQVCSDLLEQMNEAEKDQLRFQMGAALATMHKATGPAFGYPHPTPLFDNWADAFTSMVEDLLRDIEARQIAVPADEVRALIQRSRPLLEQVTTPVLVNFDLWEANMFVTKQEGHWKLSAVLDFERVFYGDPLADFVAWNGLYQSFEQTPAAQEGYRSVNPDLVLDSSALARIALYRMYLMLVMIGETPRYEPAMGQGMLQFSTQILRQILAAFSHEPGERQP